jgi:hypothetical protein
LHYKYRSHIRPAEVSLIAIQKSLFSFFGIKEGENPEQLESKIAQMTGHKTIPKEVMQAWYKAGMPSPFDKWLADYRKAK